MGKAARRVISCAYLFISIPFGIIFLLMLFTVLKGLDTTGYVYVKGIFDFVFVYIFLNFLLSLLMGSFLMFVNEVNPLLMKTVTVLTFVLLMHDLPPLKAVVEDIESGVPVGVPWPVLLMAIHVILFAVLARHWPALGAPGARAEEANA